MKTFLNILLGMIFGLILATTIPSNAYNDSYTEWQQEVIELLEELVTHGEDISSDTQTIIDKL